MEQKVEKFKLLDQFHNERCVFYANIKKNLFESRDIKTLADLPYLPANLFKKMDLKQSLL